MRWKAINYSHPPKPGDKRQVSGFLLFPRCLGGEWRWLEHAEWEQEFVNFTDCVAWVNKRWINP